MSQDAKLSQRIQPHEATPWVIEAIRSVETSLEVSQGEVHRLTRELAEAKARALPDGWAAVPVADKITRKMVAAMMDVVFSGREQLGDPTMRSIYRAMLSARPECPPNGLPSKESGNE